jgi:hypothetical protein
MKAVHFTATLSLACSLWLLTAVFVADRANASTLTLSVTQTAGGRTQVGEPDSVSSLSFANSSATFSQQIDTLSPVIFQDLTRGTAIFEVDFTAVSPPILETFAFQNVLFTAITLGANAESETVSFNFARETFTETPLPVATPLPAALPLFATGLSGLGLLGWRRKRRKRSPNSIAIFATGRRASGRNERPKLMSLVSTSDSVPRLNGTIK